MPRGEKERVTAPPNDAPMAMFDSTTNFRTNNSRTITPDLPSRLLGTGLMVMTLGSDAELPNEGDVVYLIRGAGNDSSVYIGDEDDFLLGKYDSVHAANLAFVLQQDEIQTTAVVLFKTSLSNTHCTIQITYLLKSTGTVDANQVRAAQLQLQNRLGRIFEPTNVDSPPSSRTVNQRTTSAFTSQHQRAQLMEIAVSKPKKTTSTLDQEEDAWWEDTPLTKPSARRIMNQRTTSAFMNHQQRAQLMAMAVAKPKEMTSPLVQDEDAWWEDTPSIKPSARKRSSESPALSSCDSDCEPDEAKPRSINAPYNGSDKKISSTSISLARRMEPTNSYPSLPKVVSGTATRPSSMIILGWSDFTIMGVMYSAGNTSEGDTVTLVQDTHNVHIPNAIGVLDNQGIKLGLIRETDTQFSEFLSSNAHILVEAITIGPHASDIPILVSYKYDCSNTNIQPTTEESYGSLTQMLGCNFQPAPGTEIYAKKAAPKPPVPQVQLPVAQRSSEKPPAPDKSVDDELQTIGSCTLSLVGTLFHSGYAQVNVSDQLALVREKENEYDTNAIRVQTASGATIGHIELEHAKKLAKIMDNYELIHCVATLSGERQFNVVPMMVRFATTANHVSRYIDILTACLGGMFQAVEVSSKAASIKAVDMNAATSASLGAAALSSLPLVLTVDDNDEEISDTNTQILGYSTLVLVNYTDKKSSDFVSVGDIVNLVRERKYHYGKHAIRVDTLTGTTIGFVWKTQGSMLARIMDHYDSITCIASIEAKGVAKGRNNYSTGTTIKVEYACSPAQITHFRNVLSAHLQGNFRATTDDTAPVGSISTTLGINAPDAVSSRAVQASVHTQAIDWQAQREEIDRLFEKQSESRFNDLPPYETPSLLSHLTFYDFQKQGIAWLINQERGSIPSYIEEIEFQGRKIWKCQITKAKLYTTPKPTRSAILADDMGLGKTLQTLALIVANPPGNFKSYPLPKEHGLDADDAPRATLIVAPKSVIANWMSQIKQHINRDDSKYLSVAVYHGNNRHKVLSLIKKGMVDIVLSTYQTLSSDLKLMMEIKGKATKPKAKMNQPLSDEDDESDDSVYYRKQLQRESKPKRRKTNIWIFDLQFHRLVLDEAHIIKNNESKAFEAMMLLSAERKLCLTGTIMLNKPNDIFSLLAFLEIQPLCNKDIFDAYVSEPIRERREIGLFRLRTVLAFICLRRTKAAVMQHIQLAPKTVELRLIEFPADSVHKSTYDAMYKTAREYFVDYLEMSKEQRKENKSGKRFMELLGLILRIRQACNHFCLIPGDYRQRAVELNESLVTLTQEEGFSLLAHLRGVFADDELVECAVCFNELEHENATILRKCKHVFCETCLQDIEVQVCPLCREPYTTDDLVKTHSAKVASKGFPPKLNATEAFETHGRSPKMQAMLDVIDEMQDDEKCVIFSQWTSMLNLIAADFRDLGYTYTRIDGSMNTQQRFNAMNDFETGEPRFILCSLSEQQWRSLLYSLSFFVLILASLV
ncbi:hypothetical protein MPSEU_000971300 [Mayamaea pseudoterrestris]|nr:hypothetical protein MPSEU_000971300 [Mayamaea pseudoterrestris]